MATSQIPVGTTGAAPSTRKDIAPACTCPASSQLSTAPTAAVPFSDMFSDPFFNSMGIAPFGGPFAGFGGGLLPRTATDLLPRMNNMLSTTMQQLPVIRCDVKESDAQFEVIADVPGVPKDNVKVEVSADNVLSISTAGKTERAEEGERGGWRFHRQERSQSSASRNLQLPAACNTGAITANVSNGVLHVVVPKQAGQQMPASRRIAIA